MPASDVADQPITDEDLVRLRDAAKHSGNEELARFYEGVRFMLAAMKRGDGVYVINPGNPAEVERRVPDRKTGEWVPHRVEVVDLIPAFYQDRREPSPVFRTPSGRAPRGRRAIARARARSPGDDDPPERSPRFCGYCGKTLEGRRPNVRYCTPSHAVMACQTRKREREHERDALDERQRLERHRLAVRRLGGLSYEQRALALLAVVWPSEAQAILDAADERRAHGDNERRLVAA